MTFHTPNSFTERFAGSFRPILFSTESHFRLISIGQIFPPLRLISPKFFLVALGLCTLSMASFRQHLTENDWNTFGRPFSFSWHVGLAVHWTVSGTTALGGRSVERQTLIVETVCVCVSDCVSVWVCGRGLLKLLLTNQCNYSNVGRSFLWNHRHQQDEW